MTMRRMMLLLIIGAWLSPVFGAFGVYEFDDPDDAKRFRQMSEELRCMVCQNQSLADSNAELAQDLRRELYNLIVEGKSNREIADFMVARYGDFVLYRPPLTSSTLMLWVGPVILMVIGLIVMIVFARKFNMTPNGAKLSKEEQQRLERLLREQAGDNG